MPLPLLIPIIGIAADAIAIGADVILSGTIDGQISQLENLLDHIETGATLQDLLSDCWLFLVGGFFIFLLGLLIAFPRRRRA